MLFYITNGLIVKNDDKRYLHIRKVLRNLLTGYSERKLLLLADYEVLQWMLKLFADDEDLVSPIKYLFNNYAIMGIPDEIKFYWEVVNSETLETQRNDGDKTIFSISYLVLQDSTSVQKCTLIGEDYNDCSFYKYVLFWYKQYEGQNISCAFQDNPGNGDRMRRKVAEFAHCYRPAFALVDTDDRYEGQVHNAQTTKEKCERAARSHTCTFRLEILPVHEVENLVPLNYIDKLDWNESNKFKKIGLDCLRNNAHTESIIKYFDFKKGIHYKDICMDFQFKRFAEMCFYLNPHINEGKSFDAFLAKLKNDDDVVYPAVRENTLKQVLDIIRNEDSFIQKYPPELLDFQFDTWNRIGMMLLSWGCVRNPEAINV